MDIKKLTPKKLFDYEVKTEYDKCMGQKCEAFTEKELASLPEPVQKYLYYCQYIGKKKMNMARLKFEDVHFKMKVGSPWIKIKYEQCNFVQEPARFAYIYSRMFGLIPFEGRDKYHNGKGSMLGRILKRKTIFDVVGDEINVSAAVTYLSEVLIVPNCALQNYITWESIDSTHCRAAIDYKGTIVGGTFTFNEKGEFMSFQTDDRYMYMDNGISEKHRWSAVVSDYVERGGIKMPSRVKGVWNLEGGDHEYFDGTLADVAYE